MRRSHILCAAGIAILASAGFAQQAPTSDGPYKVVKSDKVGGVGGFDYVYADVDGRRLYVPRLAGGGRGRGGPAANATPAAAPAAGTGSRVDVYDLDTLAPVGSIPNTNGVHGAAVDPKSHHGFASCNPVVMWDTNDLKTIKTISAQGSPDGILFEPFSERVFVFSHSQPNATVIDATDGSVVGTMDLGGAPEQAQSDGAGHLYVDLEDQNAIAVVDPKALKVTETYSLGDKGEGPGGLGLDAKNHILFAMCGGSQNCVILSAEDGKIITTLPIGNGTDGGAFNPNTMEAFSSQRDGTLTVIKEKSPTDFVVEQTVKTMTGGKTCTIDTKTNRIIVIATDYSGAATQPAPAAGGGAGGGGGGGAGGGGRGGRGGGRGQQAPPNSFTILAVGQ